MPRIRMNNNKRQTLLTLLPLRMLSAATLAWGLIGTPSTALALAKKNSATHAAGPSTGAAGKTAGQAHAKAAARSTARGSIKGNTKTSAKSAGKLARAAKAKGLPVISHAAPPAAVLAQVPPTTIQTGCLSLPLGAGPDAAPGLSVQQLQNLMKAAAIEWPADATRCAPYAAVALPGAQTGAAAMATSVAFLPTDDRRAFVATRLQAEQPGTAHWQDLENGLPPVREVWLQSPALALAGAVMESNDPVPEVLIHELNLLVKHMRKQSGAGDAAVVRVLIQGDDDDATLAAVELIDPATGQALDSAVWVARDGEPGAYISTRGVEYERMLWQAPVDYRRISRGIGASSMLVHKRVRVALKTKKGRKPKTKMVVRAFQYKSQHIGIDFAAATGTPVVSVAEGEVLFSGPRGGYGNLVIVQHGSDVTTYYGHLSAFTPGLQEGLHVRRGQEIGLVGSTGFSTGPHLHFEIRKGAKYMDPANPAQQLPLWTLAPEEHEVVLTRLLQLEVTRSQSFLRTARAQQLAPQAVGQ